MIRNLLTKFKELRQAHLDAKDGRKLVGLDKFNNRYYQYYDRDGYESKRICEYARKFADDEIDLHWHAWLKHVQKDPPTPEQLKEAYSQEDQFRETVLEYEKRDSEMMANYRKELAEKMKKEKPETTQHKGYAESFEPGKWKPGDRRK